jgi:signal transduction histidine kinase
MTEQAEQRQALANFLERYQDEIAASWTEKIIAELASSNQRGAFSEINSSTSQGIVNLIGFLYTGSMEGIEGFFDELTSFASETDFFRSTVIEGVLLIKEAVLPFIWRSYAADPSTVYDLSVALDLLVRSVINQFTCQYSPSEETRLGIQQKQPEITTNTGESLQRVTNALLQRFIGLDETLDIVCTEARKLTNATGSAVLLWEDEGLLRVRSSSGTPLPALERLPVGESFAGRVINQSKPLLLNEPDNEIQAYYRNPNLKTLLATPLRANNETIGALDVVNKEGGFTEEDIQIVSLFADQAAIAIENARLHEQSEQLAVLKERQRLARELHDSVTQTLYSIKLYADATRMALSDGQTQTAAENLDELRSLAREAMLDMRMLIFELHPPKLEKEGLASALQARLEAVETRSGLQIEFYVEGERQLPLFLEEELYRIVQEALNNVVKHAEAQDVSVHLWYESDRFIMEVQDDGLGYDRALAKQSGGLGLHSIEERTQQINGQLTIESILGEGTTLRVEVEI